jgi:hypothetical protein
MNDVIENMKTNNIKYCSFSITNEVFLLTGKYREAIFEQMLSKYIFVQYYDCYYFCSNKYILINNKLLKIVKIISNKQNGMGTKLIAEDGYIYRITKRHYVQEIKKQYDLLKNNNVLCNYVVNVEFINEHVIKEEYVQGKLIRNNITIDSFIKYLKLMLMLFKERVLLTDMTTTNIVYHNNELVIIDLNDTICHNRWDFLFGMRRILFVLLFHVY